MSRTYRQKGVRQTEPNDFLTHFHHVKQVGGSQWCADCPACGDKKQHLYINFAPDGKILLDCKKGCTFSEIASAVDIPQKELFGESPQAVRWELIREHVYTDINGGILGKKQIYRKPDGNKTAIWYRLENGRYIKGLCGIKFPPYHLHKFTKTTGTLVIVEGEKDVETVERLGIAATTSPNGAGAKWRKEYNAYLTGRNIVIITDNDDAGRKYGEETADRIRTAAAAVKLIHSEDIYPDLQHKGDISDIAAALGDAETKRLLTEAVTRSEKFMPAPAPPKPNVTAYTYTDQPNDPLYDKIVALPRPAETFAPNDRGNSELFSMLFSDVCRYNNTAKEWYVYQNGYWQLDMGGMMTSRLAKDMHRQLIRYSATITDEGKQKAFLDNLNKMSRLTVRESMIRDARDQNCFRAEDLDRDIWLFNCKNGTYDLKNGYFRKHSPDDLISRMSNVKYDETASSAEFEKFFREILMNDTAKMRFLQTVFGYSLTGDTSEECMFMLYGATTRNGKGTLMETIGHMMGGDNGYAATVPPEVFAVRKNVDSRQASGDIARLKGVRFANSSEPPKGMQLDAARIKTLTGRDTITARQIYEREKQFIPQFKLCMNTNYLPQINDDTVFGSDRIRVITFERHFEDSERDRTLKDRLKTEKNISGLFNWCLVGLERWKKEGLVVPGIVKSATEQYRNSSDKQAIFFNECMIADNFASTKAKDVFDVYRAWCRDNNFYAENKSNFFAGLRSKNLLTDHAWVNGSTIFNVIQGYRIAEEYAPGCVPDRPDDDLPPF